LSTTPERGPRAASVRKISIRILLLPFGLGLGAVLGGWWRYQRSQPEFWGLVEGALVAIVVGAIVVVVVLVGIVQGLRRRPSGPTLNAFSALLVLGVVVGASFGPTVYQEPRPTMTTGTMNLALDPPVSSKLTRSATCQIGPAGGWVIDASTGGLSEPRVVFRVIFIPATSSAVTIQMLGYRDNPSTREQVTVTGAGMAGSIQFGDLEVDPNAPSGPSFQTAGGTGYPTGISGTLAWTCAAPQPSS
jgi:hypothetical protein